MNILRKVVNRRFLCQHKELAGIRTLFTPGTLGVTAYISNRELELMYTSQPEQFKEEFRGKVELAVPLNLLVDNLKKYLHLMSSQRDDIELLWKALRLFNTKRDQWQQKSQIDIKKNYIFGPITMRVLHYHDLPECAIKFFEDDNITHLFDQLITYQILLDMLYDRKMYGDVLRIYDEVKKRILAQNQYVSNAINAIVFATYYRLNTPNHDELAYDMYNELKACGQHEKQYRKSIALVAAMRLKRHQPDESLEILSIHDDIDVNIRYVRILSYTFLAQFEEVFRLLEMTLAPTHTDQIIKIPDHLLQKIERGLKKTSNDNYNKRYQSIYDELKRLDRILYKRLDDVLCARFPTQMAPYKPNKKFGHGSF
ncbi:pentatricopeptide repeat-containing protein 2, mitochondrial-like [Sitodiplosis mosellana]|uniref:pentatricopeptide repeat-containing protein 2, mitochondrial-like n=1 Tax=Sitodiplosis mosellana TaxID=263140 RepID=UPI002443CA47|nr:pentatricopeptide repeat-containing protein 2, mitochondrial-like [Sitodiplosis mosellana]